MSNFMTELASISPWLPMLVEIAILSLVVIGLWTILSLPGYWLCRTIGVFMLACSERLSRTRKALMAASWVTFGRSGEPIDQFVASHAQMFSFASENQQIRDDISRLRQTVEGIPTRLQALEAGIVDAGKNFAAAAENLSTHELPVGVTAPSASEFHAIQKGRNHAAVMLCGALLITPALVAFNTAMLSRFLEGFEPGAEILGFSQSLLLAGFASLIEIMLGALLAWLPSRPAQFIIFSCIAGLAFLECIFYALMGQGFGISPFDAFYSPDPAPVWTKAWFGLFGPILVVCLTGAGHVLVTSINQLAETHVVRQWKAYLTQRIGSARKIRELLSDAERAKVGLEKDLGEVRSFIGQTEKDSLSIIDVIETAKEQLLESVKRASAIRMEDTRRLDRGAMVRQFNECLFYALGIAVAAGILAAVYSTAIITGPFFTLVGWPLGVTIAVAQSAVLILAGSATSRASITLPAMDGVPATNLPSSKLGIVAGFAILAAVAVGDAFYALGTLTALNLFVFASLLASSFALFWCGSKIGLIGAALWSLGLCAAIVFASIVLLVTGLLIGFVQLVLLVWRAILIAVAYPYSLIFLKDPTGSQLIPRAAT